MEYCAKYKIDYVIESLINGQFKQAKQQLTYKCKSKPEKMARKTGQLVGALIERDQSDLAARFLRTLDKE